MATTFGGLVAVAASIAAALTIWILIAAPTTVAARLLDGPGTQPLAVAARIVYDTFVQLLAYL